MSVEPPPVPPTPISLYTEPDWLMVWFGIMHFTVFWLAVKLDCERLWYLSCTFTKGSGLPYLTIHAELLFLKVFLPVCVLLPWTSLVPRTKRKRSRGKCKTEFTHTERQRTIALGLICLMWKSRSVKKKYYKLSLFCAEGILFYDLLFSLFLPLPHFFGSIFLFTWWSPEPDTLQILPVFKAVIKWSLLDFREMIMVPKMTESGSWWQNPPLIRRQQ